MPIGRKELTVPEHRLHRAVSCRARARRGLTLIEILIVIAILLAIAGLVVVNLLPARDQADIDLTKVQIDQIGEALDRFSLDMRRFPTEDEGLDVLWNQELLEDEQEQQNWRGPYMDQLSADPWGNDWVYRFPGEIRGEEYYDLISYGPDGEEGTEDDITNHDRLRNEEGEIETFDDFSPQP